MLPSTTGGERKAVEAIADEFLDRKPRGEPATAEEYAQAHPELADEILGLFPALLTVETLGGDAASCTSSITSVATSPSGGSTTPGRLGDYRILRVIGEGGMGVVYEAEHEALKTRVALKVMHSRFRSDRTYLRRFQIEARSAAILHHTNIVAVFDFGEQDGICYYAMQYIAGVGVDRVLDDVRRVRSGADGASVAATGRKGDDQRSAPVDGLLLAATQGLLTGWLATAPAIPGEPSPTPTECLDPDRSDQAEFGVGPDCRATATATAAAAGCSASSSLAAQRESVYFREIARLGAQVADALDHAHRQGVIHRDIKPSNLLLDTQGNVWVTDFGLAKFLEGDGLSQSHDLVGTLRFMAPERYRGVTDRRGDIYALGATLYELLTTQPAFAERDHALLIHCIAHQPPAPLRQHDRRIPPDLETIVLKVLSKEPKDRCETAGELRDELRRFLDGRPTRWRRVGPAEQFRRWCKRNPVVAGLSAVAAALIVLTALVATVAAWRFKRDGEAIRSNLRDSYLAQAQALRSSGRAGRRFAALDAVSKATEIRPGADLRDEAIACLALTDLRVLPGSKEAGPRPWTVAFDRALERYALGVDDDRGNISIRLVADHREVLRLPGPGVPAGMLRFSPDGRYLAVKYDSNNPSEPNRSLVWHLGRAQPVVAIAHADWGGNWEFSADSRRLAVCQRDGSITIFEMDSGRRLTKLGEGPTPRYLAWHPDGSKLATSDGPIRGIRVYDVSTGRRLFDLQAPELPSGQVIAWSPDGTKLARACDDGQIVIWEAVEGGQPTTLKGHSSRASCVAFSHRGHLLATTSWDMTIRLWDPARGKQLVSIAGEWPQVSFSRDDERMGFVLHEALRMCEVADGREVLTFALPPYDFPSVDFSPDGALMAVGGGDGVRLWDVAAARQITFWPVHGLRSALFQPDGRGVLTSGVSGLLRWPIAADQTAGGKSLGIQAPRKFEPPTFHAPGYLSLASDGRTAAVGNSSHSQAVVLDLQTGEVLFRGEQPVADAIAISPAGRWLASSAWVGPARPDVKLWDLQTGMLAWTLPGTTGRVLFSPDGRWLIIGLAGEYQVREVGTWRLSRRIPRESSELVGPVAFARDGSIMAIVPATGRIRLMDQATLKELATLTSPESSSSEPQRIESLAFSPDGTLLAAACRIPRVVQLWNLRLIRRELAALSLDWDRPAFPDASILESPGPLKVTIDPGVLASTAGTPEAILERQPTQLNDHPGDAEAYHHSGHALFRLERYEEAIADFSAALKVRPNDAHLLACRGLAQVSLDRLEAALCDCEAALRQKPAPDARESLAQLCNDIAWTVVIGAGPTLDTARALKLARSAVELAPAQAIYHTTLGAVLYRARRYTQALSVLERNRAAGNEADGLDLFVLAMTHFQLGQTAQARADFDRALSWQSHHRNLSARWTAELTILQYEARALVEGPPPELPADVFAPTPPDRR